MRELDKQEGQTSEKMRLSYFDHVSIDVLERFVLHRSCEEEVELVETHILACESCVSALENLESEIAATKLALEQITREQAQKTLAAQARKSAWRSWFTVPTLSWAGAGLAACALCLVTFMPATVDLKANRGTETTVVPEWRNTHLNLLDEGLPVGPLSVEVANATGSVIWSGTTISESGQVKLALPRMTRGGHYYVRLYTSNSEHELLSEFPFEVKFKL